MMTELVGGTVRYDVMAAITDFMPEFIGGGYLEPLDSLIENDPPEGWPDDFPDSLLRYQKMLMEKFMVCPGGMDQLCFIIEKISLKTRKRKKISKRNMVMSSSQ